MAECLVITTTALKSLLPFPTSYLCEAGFSTATATKTKMRIRLDIGNTLPVSFRPQMELSHGVTVRCIFHALSICFCSVFYFEDMFKCYHGNQQGLG